MSNTKTSGLALARSLGISTPKASERLFWNREGYHPFLGEMDIFMAPFTIHNYSKGDVIFCDFFFLNNFCWIGFLIVRYSISAPQPCDMSILESRPLKSFFVRMYILTTGLRLVADYSIRPQGHQSNNHWTNQKIRRKAWCNNEAPLVDSTVGWLIQWLIEWWSPHH